ncbi:Fe-S cluster assembly protein SufD [Legionella sp. MW5194]|uniref:Fe-S cluster assembly protein SufD n=1 Tax=Legionella sp. MW5194 TaxID=2662448 RepID=UPI00193E037E|nr:Fe-S cluster assembly protein SufD [Legionella sp. MW5194]QRN03214.1 Fe-S cluster assembly protein SufD [Legionella sp. MW5194]
MSEVLNFYQQQAQASLSPIAWLADLQKKALRDFTRQGFPAKHQEDWKYTSLDGFLQQPFTEAGASFPAVDTERSESPCALRLKVYNGHVLGTEALASQLPPGMKVQSLQDALKTNPEHVKPWLGQIVRHEHGFQALNSAMMQRGVVIYLPAGVILEEPLFIEHWQDNEHQAVHTRQLIIAEAGSEATVVECFQGRSGRCYLSNALTEIHVDSGARLTHYKIQNESRAAYHVGEVVAHVAAQGQFNSQSLSVGSKMARSDTRITFKGKNAQALMNGIYMTSDNQHVDHHTVVNHEVPDCHSEQDYKGILSGRCRAVFNGKVIVAKNAQHTEAHQQNKNLLLSAQAEIDTKPQLEIFADDVICSHGATVGQLDEDALFYLATRGIERSEAVYYLIHAFAAANLRLIPHRQLADWMAALISQQLRALS